MLYTPFTSGAPVSEQQYIHRIKQLENQVQSLQEHIRRLNGMLTQRAGVVVATQDNVQYGPHLAALPSPAAARKQVNVLDVKPKPFKAEHIEVRYSLVAKTGDHLQLSALEDEFGKISDDKIGDDIRLNALKMALIARKKEIVKMIASNVTYAHQNDAINLIALHGSRDCILEAFDIFKGYPSMKGQIIEALYTHKRFDVLADILEQKELTDRIKLGRGFDSVFMRAAQCNDMKTFCMLYGHVSALAKQQAYVFAKEKDVKLVFDYLMTSKENALDIRSILNTIGKEGKAGREILWKLDALWFPNHVDAILKRLELDGENDMVRHLHKTYLGVKKDVVINATKTTTKTKVITHQTQDVRVDSQPALVFSTTRRKTSSDTVAIQMPGSQLEVPKQSDKKDYTRIKNLLS